VLAVEGYTDGDKRYIRVKPSLDEAAARRFFVAPAPPANKDSAPDAADKDSAARSVAAPAPAVADDKKPAAAESESKSDAAAAAGKPAPSTPDTVLAQTRDEAAKLEARLEGWTFEIPAWSYDSIFVHP
jgi:hypothetical protein